jgi:hypothetical protein
MTLASKSFEASITWEYDISAPKGWLTMNISDAMKLKGEVKNSACIDLRMLDIPDEGLFRSMILLKTLLVLFSKLGKTVLNVVARRFFNLSKRA